MADVRTDAVTVRTSRRARLTFALVAAVIGAGLGAAAAVMYYSTRSGDEPPIWVKNGSIVIELAGTQGKWNQQSGSARWGIPNTARAHDQYEIFIAPSKAASCPNGFHHTGQTVAFKYSDGEQVAFDATGKHSAVEPSNPNKLTNPSNKILTYDDNGGGHITDILVNSTPVCSFGAVKDGNLTVVLLDK